MTVRVWNSYSCNNSSSFRLVARFSTPEAADAVATELRAWFPRHAEEIDQREDYNEEPSDAQRELGSKYGFTWGDSMYWGDGGLGGDEPDVFTHDNVLIVQHTYCGGLGDLASLVAAAGATATDADDIRTVPVSILFTAPRDEQGALDRELSELFDQLDNRKDQWTEVKAPWAEHETYGDASHFRDSGTVGIYMSLDPRDLDALKAWLAKYSNHVSLAIDERADHAKFAAIAKATCSACSGGLDYLDPRIHDIETPQLICKPCGGLYEVATFLPT